MVPQTVQRYVTYVLAGICILLIHGSAWSQEFALRDNGAVRIGELDFASMQDYLRSDYFRENGMRCKARLRQSGMGSSRARSAAHCTNILTSIQRGWLTSVRELLIQVERVRQHEAPVAQEWQYN